MQLITAGVITKGLTLLLFYESYHEILHEADGSRDILLEISLSTRWNNGIDPQEWLTMFVKLFDFFNGLEL